MLSGLFGNLHVAATIALAAACALAYTIARFRSGRKQFTLLDAATIVLLMVVVSGATIPLLEAASDGARESALLENLNTLRSQIALYKVEHGGEAPLLYQGKFPQLTHATDASGTPGQPGRQHPFGPYLPDGMLVNPITGRAVVTETSVFPPTASSGNGGWLFHQESGQIAADLPEMLDR